MIVESNASAMDRMAALLADGGRDESESFMALMREISAEHPVPLGDPLPVHEQ